MRIPLVMLVGALGLFASAAAAAANNSAPAAAASAPAAPAAAPAPAAGGGARGSSSGTGHGFAGGGHGFAGGARAASTFSGGAARGNFGVVSRGGTIARPGRASGFDYIVAGRGGAEARGAPTGGSAIRGERAVRSLTWAPPTASAAHAVRVADGLQARYGRAVRPLHELKDHRVVQRSGQLPGPPLKCIGGGPGFPCPVPFQANLSTYQTTPPPSYFCGSFASVHPCAPVLMPESLCSPANPYRAFQCPRPRKTAVPN